MRSVAKRQVASQVKPRNAVLGGSADRECISECLLQPRYRSTTSPSPDSVGGGIQVSALPRLCGRDVEERDRGSSSRWIVKSGERKRNGLSLSADSGSYCYLLSPANPDHLRSACTVCSKATVRPAAVAGVFYPADPNELRWSIESLLSGRRRHRTSTSASGCSSFPCWLCLLRSHRRMAQSTRGGDRGAV